MSSVVVRDGVAYVRFRWGPSTASGARKGWGKVVTGIDRSQRGGYAVSGIFLSAGAQELPAGTVLLDMAPGGSVKNPTRSYTIGIVCPDMPSGAISTEAAISPEFLDKIEAQLALQADRQAKALQAAHPGVTTLRRVDLSGMSRAELLVLQVDVANALNGGTLEVPNPTQHART